MPNVRVLATLPQDTLTAAVGCMRIPPPGGVGDERELTAAEITQVALVWRVARQMFSLPDVDPLVVDTTPRVGRTAPAPSAVDPSPRKKV